MYYGIPWGFHIIILYELPMIMCQQKRLKCFGKFHDVPVILHSIVTVPGNFSEEYNFKLLGKDSRLRLITITRLCNIQRFL